MSFPVKIKSSCHEYIKTHKCQFLLKKNVKVQTVNAQTVWGIYKQNIVHTRTWSYIEIHSIVEKIEKKIFWYGLA